MNGKIRSTFTRVFRSKWKYPAITAISLLIVFSIVGIQRVFAFSAYEGDDRLTILAWHVKYNQYLSFGDAPGIDVFRWLGHKIIVGLAILNEGMESLVYESFEYFDWINYLNSNSFMTNVINKIWVSFSVLSLIIIGVKMGVSKNPPKVKTTLYNVVIIMFLLLNLPTLMNMFQDYTEVFYRGVVSDSNETREVLPDDQLRPIADGDQMVEVKSSMTMNVLRNNYNDLDLLVNKGFDSVFAEEAPETVVINNYNGFRSMPINQLYTVEYLNDRIEEQGDSLPDLNNLKYRIGPSYYGTSDVYEVEDGSGLLTSIFGDAFNIGYYRYTFNFFGAGITLIALLVAYTFTLFNFASAVIEIGFKRILFMLFAPFDFETGEKTKMMINDIFVGYLTFAMTGLQLRIFTIYMNWLSGSGINWILYIIFTISGVIGLILGSNTILKYAGVDVNLQRGFGQMMAAGALGAKAAGAFKGLKNKGENKDKSGRKDTETNYGSTRQDLDESSREAGQNMASKFGELRGRGLGGTAKDAAKRAGRKAMDVSGASEIGGFAAGALGAAGLESYKSGKEKGEEKRKAVTTKPEASIKETSNTEGERNSTQGSNSENISQEQNAKQQTNKNNQEVNTEGVSQRQNDQHSTNKNDQKISDGIKGDGSSQINKHELSESDKANRYKEDSATANSNNPAKVDNTKDNRQSGSGRMDSNATGMNKDSLEKAVNTSANQSESKRKIQEELKQVDFNDPKEATRKLNEMVSQSSLSKQEQDNLRKTISGSENVSPKDREQLIKERLQADTMKSSTNDRVNDTVAQGSTRTTQNTNGSQVGKATQEVEQRINSASNISNSSIQGHQVNGATPSKVTQEVEQSMRRMAFVEPKKDVEKIAQQIERASAPSTPDIVIQKVKQELEGSGVTPQVSNAIQKIVRESTDSGNYMDVSNVIQKVNRELIDNNVPEAERTKVVQDVVRNTMGHNESVATQELAQKVRTSTTPNTEQVTQNVEKRLRGASIPNESKEQIIQTIRKSSGQGADLNKIQTQVVKQLNEVDLGSSNRSRNSVQTIQQQVSRAFDATPYQARQNAMKILKDEKKNDTKLRERLLSENRI